jgi:hypothetical protein
MPELLLDVLMSQPNVSICCKLCFDMLTIREDSKYENILITCSNTAVCAEKQTVALQEPFCCVGVLLATFKTAGQCAKCLVMNTIV